MRRMMHSLLRDELVRLVGLGPVTAREVYDELVKIPMHSRTSHDTVRANLDALAVHGWLVKSKTSRGRVNFSINSVKSD